MRWLLVGALLWTASVEAETFFRNRRLLQVGPKPNAIVAQDLNGDGLPDIITADLGTMRDTREEVPAHDQVSLLIAQGDLEYKPLPQLKTGFGPYCVVVANMDGLKAPDLVVGNFLATRNRDLALFRNLGEGLFEPSYYEVPDDVVPYTKMRDGDNFPVFTTPGITAIAVGDLDADGYRDVVATGWSSDVVIVFPGAAEPYITEPMIIEAEGGPRSLQLRDFDGDGVLDLAASMYNSGELALWRGTGDRAFEEVMRFPSRGRLPHQLRVADMNGDGREDLIVSHCFSDDSVVIFYGGEGFNFSTSQEIMLDANRETVDHEIRDIVVDDLDADGRLDIAAACYTSNRVALLLNRSEDAALPQTFEEEWYRFDRGKPRALATADFNQDDKPDLAVALWDANGVALLLGR